MPPRAALIFTIVLQYLAITILCDVPAKISPPFVRILDASNPFRENLAKNISVDDAAVKQRLWARHDREPTRTTKRGPKIIEYKLNNPKDKTKRADYGPAPYNSLIDFKSCLFCEGKAKRDSTLSMSQFQAEDLIRKMDYFATAGFCLFYGQRAKGADPRSLSQMATEYACGFGGGILGRNLRTIWQLWPNEGCDTEQNYYCLNPRAPGCCWLNPLMPSQDIDGRIAESMLYFQQMSRAMALTCVGEVFILIDDPEMIPKQQPHEEWTSIWLSHEKPVLEGLYAEGTVTKLTAVKVSDKSYVDVTKFLKTNNGNAPRTIDWNEPIARAVRKKKAELMNSGFYNNTMSADEFSKLQRRAGACGAADQEAPGMDYFG